MYNLSTKLPQVKSFTTTTKVKFITSQLKTKQAFQAREEELKSEECSFRPTFFSVPVKTFEGSAKELTEKSGKNFVARQQKARKDKEEQQQKLLWTGPKSAKKSNMAPSNLPFETVRGSTSVGGIEKIGTNEGDAEVSMAGGEITKDFEIGDHSRDYYSQRSSSSSNIKSGGHNSPNNIGNDDVQVTAIHICIHIYTYIDTHTHTYTHYIHSHYTHYIYVSMYIQRTHTLYM